MTQRLLFIVSHIKFNSSPREEWGGESEKGRVRLSYPQRCSLCQGQGEGAEGAGGGGRVGGQVKKTKCFVYIECALRSYS